MKSQILHTSYVIKFLDVGFNSDRVSKMLEPETNAMLKKVQIQELAEWKVEFRITYDKGDLIEISKKLPSYSIEKLKKITVFIPIPSNKTIPWGVAEDQFIGRKVSSGNTKNDILEVDFKAYNNLTDFIVDSIRRAIHFTLKSGFTVAGFKVKIDSK